MNHKVSRALVYMLFIFNAPNTFSQYYSWDGKTLLLDNGIIKRNIVFNQDSSKLVTRQLLLKNHKADYIVGEFTDF